MALKKYATAGENAYSHKLKLKREDKEAFLGEDMGRLRIVSGVNRVLF